MSLDLSKLENARQRGEKIIARCPACAEHGHDEKGEHLVIMSDGRFGCVTCPGAAGKEHRQRIYALAGDGSLSRRGSSMIRVRRPVLPKLPEIAGVSPHLGQVGTAGTPLSNPRATGAVGMDHDAMNKKSPTRKDEREASQASQAVPNPLEVIVTLPHAAQVEQPAEIISGTTKMLGGLIPYVSHGIEQQRVWLELAGFVELADDNQTIRAMKRIPDHAQAVAAFHAGIMLVAALKAGADDESAGIVASDAVRGLLGIGMSNPDDPF